jgi:hypothetical protein
VTRILGPGAAATEFEAAAARYEAKREARLGPLMGAVRQVLKDARGIFIRDGFVTSFIVTQLQSRFPQVAGVTPRQVLYALNALERRGEVERVETTKRRPSGKLVPVNRWRRPAMSCVNRRRTVGD